MLQFLQEGTGVSSVRSGAVASDRATAYEIAKTAQGGEVRTVEFIRGLTSNLRSFLYMQHALNKLKLNKYSFYNDEMESQDFMIASKGDLPPDAHFEVTGAKGILGEEQRINRTTAVTGFAAQSPLFAPLLKPRELLMEMYKDAGQKNPEQFLKSEDEAVDPMVQQLQQMVQELQAQLQQAEMKTEQELAKIQMQRESTAEQNAMKAEQIKLDHQLEVTKMIGEFKLDLQKMQADMEMKQVETAAKLQMQVQEANAKAEALSQQASRKKTRKTLKYNEEGDIVEIGEESE
jgi:hypothetical protein